MSALHLSARGIDPEEVAYFERLAHRWWDTEGPFWPLHRLNAFRVEYIRRHLADVLDRDPSADRPFEGLRLLDIGCGGGILSESMARLGARVTGSEISEKNVGVAQVHAQMSGLEIDYRLATAADLVSAGEQYDAVLNMEVIEHVEHLPEFLADCGRLVRPGGVMFVASINRTLAALVIAIIGAEQVLRWLPRGTHHYRKLVRPAEVRAALGDDFVLRDQTGVRVNPLNRAFSYTRWMGVNYMLVMQRR
ncbi:MAG: bifunctional 2-polyprenyl-6-hydroxyphenol methylase/3-demethylubiquinol 3-O-methyltransferase UbiG [Thiocapsa sp.]|jgi:2-polyprenyl-6-hydroxyphenyl methylase/3-demethylubiquinone-9 3-methyltransferase|nr:bifunctional 2-polyprenyl-6-hydroxyphenol methylase/3-demethylubiquinol 3-O-methyltransferase UbiG [Thiocapsa sp.]MCG6895933.1 bifunctional 2-polyprenyl-6-hydroxyphenol methylase/3-demethylubiquinol 3-O-methyltransferase UbiG [Thiocapsa sp.]MCG6985841.1 bifunctional 2-polyprenyl-6-hydroxyphenol methylase/3-demethylubiquinol 3-O-methyltransferase UbiG [Thiocapsa sp.]